MSKFIIFFSVALSVMALTLQDAQAEMFSNTIVRNVNDNLVTYKIIESKSPISEIILAQSNTEANVFTSRGFGISGIKDFTGSCELLKQKIAVVNDLGWQRRDDERESEFDIISFKITLSDSNNITIPLLLIGKNNKLEPLSSTSFGDVGVQFKQSDRKIKFKNGSNVRQFDFSLEKNGPSFSDIKKVKFEYQNIPRLSPVSRLGMMILDELEYRNFKCEFK